MAAVLTSLQSLLVVFSACIRATAASQLCITTGPASGYKCSPASCVGVLASCVGAYSTDCSCGDNPREWQGGECTKPTGEGCAKEAAQWCSKQEGCSAFAINAGAFQGFKETCTPWAKEAPVGACVAVPSPDWVAYTRTDASAWGSILLLALALGTICYLVAGIVFAWMRGQRGSQLLTTAHPMFWEQLQSLVLDGVAFAARRRSFDRLSHVDSRSTSRGRQHMKRDAAKSAEHSSVRHQSSRAKRSRRVQDKLETQLGSSNRIEKKRHPNLTSSDDGESRLHASNGPKSGSAEVLQGLPATARRPDQGRWVHVSS